MDLEIRDEAIDSPLDLAVFRTDSSQQLIDFLGEIDLSLDELQVAELVKRLAVVRRSCGVAERREGAAVEGRASWRGFQKVFLKFYQEFVLFLGELSKGENKVFFANFWGLLARTRIS